MGATWPDGWGQNQFFVFLSEGGRGRNFVIIKVDVHATSHTKTLFLLRIGDIFYLGLKKKLEYRKFHDAIPITIGIFTNSF